MPEQRPGRRCDGCGHAFHRDTYRGHQPWWWRVLHPGARWRAAAPGPVVTVTPTIMDGTVVRWHAGGSAEEAGRALVSASHSGVMIHGDVFLHDLPAAWLEAAQDACARIKGGRDVSRLATHRRPFGSRTLIPVDAPEARRG